jgi:hypothetical protein
MYSSNYDKLIVSGCSFTHEPDNEWKPFSWANTFGEMTGMAVTNLAIPGAGNMHIANSLILYLEKNKPAKDTTLILAMWTGPIRFDWITSSALSNFKDVYPFSYNYDEQNELVLAGNWLGSNNKTHLHKTITEYSKYQSESSLALQSWLAMSSLTNYLKQNNYKFYFTSYLNYKTNKLEQDALPIDFFAELRNIGLDLDYTNWIPLQDDEYYGDWARINNVLDTYDNFHPKYPQATEGWTKQILIPYMEQANVIKAI